MKYAILIGDGMSDMPVESLGGKTPLEHASTPNLDRLAGCGRTGLFATVPEGYPPGSDVANLSIMGYAPEKYYTGRAPLEAASIGVSLKPGDVAFRCNLVTIKATGSGDIMADYSAGHISTDEAAEIVRDLDAALSGEGVRFYPGTSYRHLMVWESAPGLTGLKTTPPHDISDNPVAGNLPDGPGEELLKRLMELSRGVMKDHPVNARRRAEGKNPATSIWLWGQGTAPDMPSLKESFGVDGAMISAVDLMKGIAVYAGLKVLKVPGITGYIDTNYAGKVEAALASLEDGDFVCVHVEAPDEAGHQGSLADKLTAIEDFDAKIVGPMIEGLRRFGDFKVLALNDHPTPVALKTHTSDPVPFAVATSGELDGGTPGVFSERAAAATGLLVTDCRAFAAEFFDAGGE